MSKLVRLTASAALAATVVITSGVLSYADSDAPIQPWLSDTLASASSGEVLTVLVHGTDLAAAHSAVEAAGLTRLRDLARIGVTIASGTADQIHAVAGEPGVSYVEGDQPIEFFLDTSHQATRGAEAAATLTGQDGQPLDGRGFSVAVIDTGVDPTHPFFREPDGSSAVVANLKNMCLVTAILVPDINDTCFVDVGPFVDTDTGSAGGHGTHVNGIVAGRPTKLSNGKTVRGAAPGAKLVSLSVGAGLSLVAPNLALQWVLDNHRAPCAPAAACPPIKVTNNSYGPVNGGEFDPNGATAKLQRALAAEGVLTVWANGNSGGDGSKNLSNPHGLDPTGGIISVASYFDDNTGTRDGKVSAYSSRGDKTRPQTWPDLSAPGEKITSSCRPYLAVCSTGLAPVNGPSSTDIWTFNTISGTSMAAPHIAGIVAQLLQAKPTATPAEVEDALKSTAYRYTNGAAYQNVGGHQTSYDKGVGLVDVVAAAVTLGAAG